MYGNMYENQNPPQPELSPPQPPKPPKRPFPASIIVALIAGVSAIACVSIFSGNIAKYKTHKNGDGISVTGSASCDFESDLVVWRGSFSAHGETPKSAYQIIKNDADIVKKYLNDNGVSDSEISFSSVSISQNWVQEYNEEGNQIGEYLDGYDLYQSVTITSEDVDKVDSISKDITQLIESNIEFSSEYPEYYYTKLDELKLDLIQQATENAKARVDIVAEGTGAHTTRLLTASLGVFQITAQNSDTEYSYGGTFDTSSRYKTATVTVRLNYDVN